MRGLVEWAQRVVESSRTVFGSRGVWLAVPSPPTLVPVAVLRRVAQRVDQPERRRRCASDDWQ